MSAAKFLLYGLVGTLLSWGTWIIVLIRIDPDSGGFVAKLLFFTSLWLALLGTATLVGFGGRFLFERQAMPYRQMTVAARQAFNISLTAMILLGLQTGRALSWWVGLLVVLIAAGVESFFLLGQARSRTDLTYGTEPHN